MDEHNRYYEKILKKPHFKCFDEHGNKHELCETLLCFYESFLSSVKTINGHQIDY